MTDLDPLSLGSVRTTPPPCVDVRTIVPELTELSRTTVRLHPRRLPADQSLPRNASKLGGEFLWPRNEPWPVCKMHGIPWVGVLQLQKADVPDLPFPEGKDLLQLLWCPQRGHGEYRTPEPVLIWRTSSAVSDRITSIPKPRLPTRIEEAEELRQSALEHDLHTLSLFERHPDFMRRSLSHFGKLPPPSSETWIPGSFFELTRNQEFPFEELQRAAAELLKDLARHLTVPQFAEKDYVPRACRLFPERVVEYLADDLSVEDRRRLETANFPAPCVRAGIENQVMDLLFRELTAADGTKVGGCVHWSQERERIRCAMGHDMDHLVTLASCEWDGANWPRWRPLEERELYDQLRAADRHEDARTLQCPAGWTLGDAASMYIFICRQCPDWPIKSIMQD